MIQPRLAFITHTRQRWQLPLMFSLAAEFGIASRGPPYNPQNYILTAPNGTKYSLTASGGVTGITEPNGKSITIGAGASITNFGKSVVFTRDGSGRITNITDPNNNKIQYAYDSLGRLSQVIDEKGQCLNLFLHRFQYLISNIERSRKLSTRK